MIIIGECINSTTSDVLNAIGDRNIEFIQNLGKEQVNAGSMVLDVNAGAKIDTEQQDMEWLVKTVWEAVKVPMSIDSANPETIKKGLETFYGLVQNSSESFKGFKAIVNSINGDRSHCEKILPLVKHYGCEVIGLLMDKNGIPDDPAERVNIGAQIIDMVKEFDIPLDKLYLDVLVQPISIDTTKGITILKTIKKVKLELKNTKTVLGLSNISFGLPVEDLINQTFLAMLMVEGLDAAILNPLDKRLMGTLKAAKMLLNQDEFCMEYISAYRNKLLEY